MSESRDDLGQRWLRPLSCCVGAGANGRGCCANAYVKTTF